MKDSGISICIDGNLIGDNFTIECRRIPNSDYSHWNVIMKIWFNEKYKGGNFLNSYSKKLAVQDDCRFTSNYIIREFEHFQSKKVGEDKIERGVILYLKNID